MTENQETKTENNTEDADLNATGPTTLEAELVGSPMQRAPESKEGVAEQAEEEEAEEQGGQEEETTDAFRYNNAEEFLEKTLVARAKKRDQKLRATLLGTILFELTDTGHRFLFETKAEELSCVRVTGDAATLPAADCTIKLSSPIVMSLCAGHLNPQLALLSEKISVSGKAGLAIYVFNLFVPFGRSRN